jgi:predicted nuclease of predicted toxin-antitoxin system
VKFKLDENLSPHSASILMESGFEADTVVQEGLGGASDTDLFAIRRREQRCLVTLDLDFADVTRFPPHEASGMAVLRSPRPITPAILRTLLRGLVDALQREVIEGRLWIIEPGRVRIHADTAPEPVALSGDGGLCV